MRGVALYILFKKYELQLNCHLSLLCNSLSSNKITTNVWKLLLLGTYIIIHTSKVKKKLYQQHISRILDTENNSLLNTYSME